MGRINSGGETRKAQSLIRRPQRVTMDERSPLSQTNFIPPNFPKWLDNPAVLRYSSTMKTATIGYMTNTSHQFTVEICVDISADDLVEGLKTGKYHRRDLGPFVLDGDGKRIANITAFPFSTHDNTPLDFKLKSQADARRNKYVLEGLTGEGLPSDLSRWTVVTSEGEEFVGAIEPLPFEGDALFDDLDAAKKFVDSFMLLVENIDFQSYRIVCPDGNIVIPYRFHDKGWLTIV